ncbi:MAG: DUF4199 domain-containing protein [Gemmatimonadetes bacterium]|nr:DUF4199 domain-containing protein [Gemmatimonadota bacterium]
MRKIVLTFGLIAGGVLSAMLLITLPFQEQIGFDKGAIIGYTTMVLAFLMVYFGVRSYRDTVLGGRISFGKACVAGLLITLVATACYVATWEAIYFGTANDFADKYAAHSLEKARAGGATEAQLAAQAAEMAKFNALYQNPLVNIAVTFLEPLPVGLLFTLLSAGLLSRKPRLQGIPVTT